MSVDVRFGKSVVLCLLLSGLLIPTLQAEIKQYTIVLPTQGDNGAKVDFNATAVEVTFSTFVSNIQAVGVKPVGGKVPASDVFPDGARKSKTIFGAETEDPLVYFSGGELKPGSSFTFECKLANEEKASLVKIRFYNLTFDNKGKLLEKKILELSRNTNPKTFKGGNFGFINNDFFDFSNPSNATFNLINNAPGDADANVQFTLQNLRIYTNLSESNYNSDSFDTVGSATPVFTAPSLVIAPNNAVSIPLGPVAAPGTLYALAIADATDSEDLSSGTQFSTGVLALADDGIAPTDQPDQTTVTASGLIYSRITRTYNGKMTVTNTGPNIITGPLTVVFTSLTPGVALTNYSGTVDPDPFLTVPLGTSLAPSQSVTFDIQFSNPSNVLINFVPSVFAGPFQ